MREAFSEDVGSTGPVAFSRARRLEYAKPGDRVACGGGTCTLLPVAICRRAVTSSVVNDVGAVLVVRRQRRGDDISAGGEPLDLHRPERHGPCLLRAGAPSRIEAETERGGHDEHPGSH